MNKAALTELLALLSQCGQLVSVFLKPKPEIRAGWDDSARLAEFLERFAEMAQEKGLGSVERESARFSILDRFEFEGSLVSVLLKGGCHGATSGLPVDAARRLIASALDAAFPSPFSDLLVYRLDSIDWCELTRDSIVSSAYIAWQSPRNLWWILCVADSD